MTPYWRRRVDGRVFLTLVYCVLLISLTTLLLMDYRQDWVARAVALAAYAAILGMTFCDLISLKRHDATILERLAERRLFGRRLGNWIAFLLYGSLSVGYFMMPRTESYWWLFGFIFAAAAIHAGWRLIRGPAPSPAPILPPLSRATWPGVDVEVAPDSNHRMKE